MSEKSGRAEATHRERTALAAQPMPSNWPQDAEGNYLAIVQGACSDLVPTVQFGNVLIGPVTIQRPVAGATIQEIIDAARETQKAAEYVVGVERRLLQWALDPASKIASPVTGQEAFAAPPEGYDKAAAPVDPRAAQEASALAAAQQPPAAPAAPPAPPAAPSATVG